MDALILSVLGGLINALSPLVAKAFQGGQSPEEAMAAARAAIPDELGPKVAALDEARDAKLRGESS